MTTIAEVIHLASLPPQAARAYIRECNMTSDERERHLYTTGRTAEAAMLAGAIDAENAAVDEMRDERDEAHAAESRLERENEDLQAAVETAEEKVLTLTTHLENAQAEISALRHEIREKSLDLL